MPSTPSSRLLIEKQAAGENLNTWGDRLNAAIELLDEAIAGVTTIPVTAPLTTLSAVNYQTDQVRPAVLRLTGAPAAAAAVQVPARQNLWLVVNATTGAAVTVKTAAGTGVVLRPGPQWIYCDGTDVAAGSPRIDQIPGPAGALSLAGQRITDLAAPTAADHAATRGYVDATAFAMADGALPGQAGQAGRFLVTDGTAAAWADLPLASAADAAAAVATGRLLTPATAAAGFLRLAGGTLAGPLRARAVVTLADAPSITPDFAAGNDFTVTLAGNRTLANPSNAAAGQGGSILIRQDATGGRTLAFGSAWVFPGATAPMLTFAGGRVDRLDYWCPDAVTVHAQLVEDIR